jgi:2-phosphosulfolactate phosphatase
MKMLFPDHGILPWRFIESSDLPMRSFVYHTPELVPAEPMPDCAVVIDVLRATTTIAAALANGAEAVQAFADLKELNEVSEHWPAAQRIRCGERGGKQVDGFDIGNSPFDFTPDVVSGKRIFMSTTNGTRSLSRVAESPVLVTASFSNISSVKNFLKERAFEQVWFVGSGWEGSYSLEDTVCAGALVHLLDSDFGNDEAVAAAALYRVWADNLVGLFELASHGKRLLALDKYKDLTYCAQFDTADILPIQISPGVLALAKK